MVSAFVVVNFIVAANVVGSFAVVAIILCTNCANSAGPYPSNLLQSPCPAMVIAIVVVIAIVAAAVVLLLSLEFLLLLLLLSLLSLSLLLSLFLLSKQPIVLQPLEKKSFSKQNKSFFGKVQLVTNL